MTYTLNVKSFTDLIYDRLIINFIAEKDRVDNFVRLHQWRSHFN